MEPINVAIVGVGNCASSLVQGVHYYKDADGGDRRSPASCTSTSAATTSATSTSSPPSTSTRTRSARTSARRSTRGQNNTYKFADVPKETGVVVSRGRTLDGLGLYLSRDHREGAAALRRRRQDPQGDQHARPDQLPARRQRRGDEVVRGAGDAGRLRHHQLHARVHRLRPDRLLAQAPRRRRRADHRRRHQVAGRLDDRPPHRWRTCS